MKWEFLKHISKKKLILVLGDCLLILLGLAVTRASGPISSGEAVPSLGQVMVVVPTFLFFFYLANLYVPLSSPFQKNKVAARIIMAVAGAALACLMLSLVNPAMNPGRHRIALLSLYMIPAAYAWRWAFERAFTRFLHPVRVLIVGAGWAGSTIGSALGSFREFRVVGFVDDDPAKRTNKIGSMPVLGATSDIQALVERHHASLLVLAITHEKRDTLFRTLLDCKMSGIELCDMPTLYEELAGRVPVNHVRDSWFVYSSLRGVRRTVYAARLKRVLDIALSFAGLVVSMPIVMVTALAFALESGSPLLYRQKRVGQNEKEFWLLKFRSMKVGAEDGTGAVWAKPGDDRVTKVGHVIRLLRFDEIPQMVNVLKGEMSFIGPRPERPEFVKELKGKIPYYSLRHTIKPGITGWAQVNYPYGASEEDAFEKLQYDLYYLKNMSALLDLHILLRTIRVVLFRQGSR
jgi:sugar transferase (PEP-CTERM system associated)